MTYEDTVAKQMGLTFPASIEASVFGLSSGSTKTVTVQNLAEWAFVTGTEIFGVVAKRPEGY